MDDCVLCRERRGLKITVKTNLSGLGIKECMLPAEKAGSPIFVPTDIVKTADGYSVFVRQKVSLKEYLARTAFETTLIKSLMKSLCVLSSTCIENNINMDFILFDYDAVYLTDISGTMEFTFLPGLRFGKEENRLKDMFGLILLHADNELTEHMSIKDKEFLDALSVALDLWDEDQIKIPVTVFSDLLKRKKKKQKTQKKKEVAKPNEAKTRKTEIKKPVLHVSKKYYLDNFPDFKKKEITVGRDGKWADFEIRHAFVSRRHAILKETDDGLLLRDLESSNGTYVDGIRINPREEISVKEGQEIRFAYGAKFKVKSKKRISIFAE